MAIANQLLQDAFDRVRETVHGVVDGLSAEQLAARVDAESNTVAWLVWHLARVQDDHVAELAGSEQVWTAHGWVDRFDLPFDASATGYGQSAEEVGSVRVEAEVLTGYLDAVQLRTQEYVDGLRDEDFPRVVDEAWDPPVTLAVRMVSVVNDCTQHAGQAAFLRGMLQRRGS